MRITDIQRSILEFICEAVREEGRPPTLREIAARFKINSASSVAYHVRMLERAGLLARRALLSRGLVPTVSPYSLPILGRAAAGTGMIAQEDVESRLEVGPDLARGAEYLIQVKGESMTGAGILDADLVQVRRQTAGDDGDIVVALIGEEAVVKRLRRAGARWTLASEQPGYASITEDFRILGKVVGVIRRYGRPS